MAATCGRGFKIIPLAALCFSAGFFALGSTLYVTSLTLVSTATISVIGASSPIFTGLLSPWVTGERPGLAAWAAAALAMAGVGVIAWNGLEAGNLAGNDAHTGHSQCCGGPRRKPRSLRP